MQNGVTGCMVFSAKCLPMCFKRHQQTPDRQGSLSVARARSCGACASHRGKERERETVRFPQPPRASNHDNRMAGRHGSSSAEGRPASLCSSDINLGRNSPSEWNKNASFCTHHTETDEKRHAHTHTSVEIQRPTASCISLSLYYP